MDESMHPCYLAPDRERADAAVKVLEASGMTAVVVPPGEHYAGLAPGAWEVRVPSTRAAQAHAILNRE